MAPKKRSKDFASSSSSAPFDWRKFWDAQAVENYMAMINRPIYREMGWDVSSSANHLVQDALEGGWSLFVKTPSDAVSSLVRKFYANLKVKHENMRVRVSGCLVAFDSQTINNLYEILNYEIDGYRSFMQEQVDYMEILNTLCHRGATWKTNVKGEIVNFKATFLKNDHWLGSYSWHHESYHLVTAQM